MGPRNVDNMPTLANLRDSSSDSEQAEERTSMPSKGCSPAEALARIQGMVKKDTDPNRNLGTFVMTTIEPEAEELILLGQRINIIDQGEYPASVWVHDECLRIIADMWHSPLADKKPVGTATVGSSEACMLGGLALKRRWQQRMGKKAGSMQPNIVLGSNYQVCWSKFARYFDVELRVVPCGEELTLTPENVTAHVDEATIGVVAILGSTFNGDFEDVAGIARELELLQKRRGWEHTVPIHVDAASGGFIAPFLQPQLRWDFRIPSVVSINASGHKFGLACAGVGWLMFRGEEDLPSDLVFTHNYLSGGEKESLTLNFSKPAGPILAQYYQFVRLGKDGYARTMKGCMGVAAQIRRALVDTGMVEVLDSGHMPMVAFRLKDETYFTVHDLAAAIDQEGGWKVPAYPVPEGSPGSDMMRIVVRPSLTRNLADQLCADVGRAMDSLLARAGVVDEAA